MTLRERLLQDALPYRDRGWSCIPMKLSIDGKKPAIRWKKYAQQLPTVADLNNWFSRPAVNGIAIITGAVSGNLAVRDFDDIKAYERWRHAHRNLSGHLPTVCTLRGCHVYCE